VKKVTILYFAALRDLTGTSEEQLGLGPSVNTIAELLTEVVKARPSLPDCLQSIRVAKNESFVELAEAVDDGDVVALIPPVQGG
jgi:molybdopterin converting factor subunit 1